MATTTAPATSSGEASAESTGLGRLGSVLSTGTEVAAPDAGQEITPEGPAAAGEQPQAEERTQEDIVAQAEEAGAEEAADESALEPTEGETDFAPEVYARYAQQFSKTHRVELDPENPSHRALLREVIQRGQAIKRMREAQAEAAEQPAEEVAAEEAAPAEQPQAQPATPEEIRAYLDQVDRFAAERIRPEFAQAFATDFLQSLWPREFAAGKLHVSPESAVALSKTMTKFGLLLFNDSLPMFLDQMVPKLVERSFPMLGRIVREAATEQALDALEARRGPDGKAIYPDLGELVDNDTIERVLEANPQIRTAEFTDAKGRRLGAAETVERRLELAVKIARGEGINPATVQAAVAKGQQQVRKAAQRAQTGKLAAGESKGAFPPAQSERDRVVSEIVESGKSGFERAMDEADRKLEERRRRLI